MAQSGCGSIPLGDGAVGARVAREFGNLGVFTGTVNRVKHGKSKRARTLYHVTYDDGDEEDLDEEEFQYAFELEKLGGQREACGGSGRGTKRRRAASNVEGEGEGEATNFDNPPPAPGTNLLSPRWTNLCPSKKFKPVVARKDVEKKNLHKCK